MRIIGTHGSHNGSPISVKATTFFHPNSATDQKRERRAFNKKKAGHVARAQSQQPVKFKKAVKS